MPGAFMLYKILREVTPLPLLVEQWMRLRSSFMLLSWQAAFFSLGWTRSDFYQLPFGGAQVKSALAVTPQFLFLPAIHTVISRPTSRFVAGAVAPLNSVKLHINKGEIVTKDIPLPRRIYCWELVVLPVIRSTQAAGWERGGSGVGAGSPAWDCRRGCVAWKASPCWIGQCSQGSLSGVTAGVPVTHTVTS